MSRRKNFETGLSSSSKSNPSARIFKPSASQRSPPAIPTPVGNRPTASVPTETAEEAGRVSSDKADTPPEVDESVQCFICAEPITFWSVGACGHRTCHICALRLRIFYKKTACTYCKTAQPSLLFTRSPTTPFPSENHLTPTSPDVIAAAQASADKLEKGQRWDKGLTLPGTLDLVEFPYKDEKTGIVFEDEDMMEATLLLLRFNCPFPDCAHMASNWDSLQRHTISSHNLSLCMLCCRQLSRFAHEQVLYPPHLLPLHDPSRLQRGQRLPRTRNESESELVKSWDAPHPVCEFCHIAFFGPDELFKHMRNSHEECHVCKELGEKDVYFQNYERLSEHFEQDHYPCRQPACLEQKFVVFGSELDYRAHMMTEHKGEMSRGEQHQARQINIDFNGEPSRGAGRQSNGRGRGFTLQRSSVPERGGSRRDVGPHQQQITPNTPMTADQAAQVRRQLQTDRQEETRRKRNFDTGLTGGAGRRGNDEAGDTPRSGFATPREDVGEATALRHAALLSRVSLMVSDNENRMSSFQSAIRSFKHSESTAKDMIDTIYNVLDRDAQATNSIVREIGSIFEEDGEKDKAKPILEAINGFRAEQEAQFPALSGPSTSSNYAGITSGQILRAKGTTHTLGRSTSSQSVWDRVEAAAASQPVARPKPTNQRYVPGSGVVLASTTAFPSLGVGPSVPSVSKATTHSTPWASGGAGSSSKSPPVLAGPQIRSVNFPTAKATRNTKAPSQAAFPSLPSSAKSSANDRKALFNKPNNREETIRRITGQGPPPPPIASRWTGNGNGVEDVTDGVEEMGVEEGGVGGQSNGTGGGGGKKKGKQKQLLFSVSARPS